MVKYLKRILITVLAITVTATIVRAATFTKTNYLNEFEGNFGYVDNLLLESSRHTQTEENDLERLEEYHQNYLVSYTESELAYLGFEKVLFNNNFILYLEKTSFSILLYDINNNFWWSSRPENQEMNDGNNLNARNLMNSGLHVELARKDNISTTRKESILTIGDALYKESYSIVDYFNDFVLEYQHLLATQQATTLKANLPNKLEDLSLAISYTFLEGNSPWNDEDTIYLHDVLKNHPQTNELGLAIAALDDSLLSDAISNLTSMLTSLEDEQFMSELTLLISNLESAVNESNEEGQISNKLKPYAIDNSSMQTTNIGTSYRQTADEITLTVNIRRLRNLNAAIDISFSVSIKLLLTGIEVKIANETINESSDLYKLLNIAVFPYFGAARQDKIPGYFVIPDEVGALVRLDKVFNASLPEMPFYNVDYGYSQTNKSNLKLPIYGVIHEYQESGFYVEVKSGASNSTLQTSLWTANTDYHRINSAFQVRQVYRTVVNRVGDGTTTILEEKTNNDYVLEYTILSNEKSSYVGIAENYRNKLIDRGILSAKEQAETNIPFHTSVILSDQEKAFIGTKKIAMTTIKELSEIYNELKNGGITNQQITLYGWSKDGYLSKAPYRVNYAFSEKQLKNFIAEVHSDNNKIFLENDYVLSTNSNQVNYYRDVSEAISRVKISFQTRTLNNEEIIYRLIKPSKALEIATKDYQKINKTGFDGLMLDSMGNTLFSEYRSGEIIERSEQITYYQQITNLYNDMQIVNPNLYLWKNLSGYVQMPIANGQYNQYSDTIPLIPLILKGSVSYFGSYLNFNVFGQDHLLQMIDYAVNPSYIYTYENTYEMRYTEAAKFYTTKFSDFKSESIANYNYINDALKHVINAFITDRVVLKTGLVKVSYSNGVSIYINYTNSNQSVGGITVLAKDYWVVN